MENQVRFPLRWDKFAAAVAYLAQQSLHDDRFGETKLVKLLYYADCAAYQRTREPITGATYIRMPHGPYPDRWQTTIESLESGGTVRLSRERVGDEYVRKHWLPGENAATAALTEREKSLLDEQLRQFAKFNGVEIEEYSHNELAWHATAQGAPMPYELSGIRRPSLPPDEETVARGRRIAKRIREEGRRVSRLVIDRDETLWCVPHGAV